jgi:hypothetical protein
MSDFVTKDSGARETFETGSKRDSREGKGRYDLISPYALKRLADVYERGARKYDARNWEKGQPQSRFLDSAKRHLENFLMGHRDEDHLAQCAWNVFALIHQEEMIRRGLKPKSLDDLPHYESDPWVPEMDELVCEAFNVSATHPPTWMYDHWEGQTDVPACHVPPARGGGC